MGRRRTSLTLAVFLNSHHVGDLHRQRSGAVSFQYAEAWLNWQYALPVSLSLPLREEPYRGDPVIAVFDNLLPDSDIIRRQLAERINADGTDVFQLLAKLGRDCIGALQLLPKGESPDAPGAIDAAPLDAHEIARRLRNLAIGTPLGIEDDTFRISIAGAQEKTALLYQHDRWYLPHGHTPTTHILKPQIGRLDNGLDLSHSVENEWFCLMFLRELGLPVTEAGIEDFDDMRTLIVTRFDRHWTSDGRLMRLPQEDCCQALSYPSTRKYQAEGGPSITAIMDLLKASNQPDNDRRCFMKAQIVYWLLAATDGHGKNFSLSLQPGGRFQLAHLYDVMSAQPNIDAGQIRRNQLKMAMAVGNNNHYVCHEILPRHFEQTAKACGFSLGTLHDIFKDLIQLVPDALQRSREQLPDDFPMPLVDAISGGITRRLQRLSP